MGPLISIAIKDLRLLARDRGGLFFVVAFPLLYAIFFGFISSAMMGGGGGGIGKIKIAVVDEDQSAASAAFAATLAAADALDAVMEPTRESAAAKVRAGERVAFVVITPGWGEASSRMFWGDPPKVEIGCDPTRGVEKGMLQGLMMEHGAARFQDMFTNSSAMRTNAREALASMDADGDMSPAVAAPLRLLLGSLDSLSTALEAQGVEDGLGGDGPSFEPVRVEQVPITRDPSRRAPNAFAISFPQAIVWGLMGAAAGFGISLVTERTKGTMTRLRTAPITSRHILAGKALACWLTAISVCALLLGVGVVGFKVRPQSWALLAGGVFCASVCFTGIMMLLSVIGRTEQSAGGIGWAALTVMAMIGGGMVPLFVLEKVPVMSMLSHASPVKWAIYALEGGLWRGLTLAQLAPSFGVLLAIGVAGLAAGSWLFPRLERH